MAFAEWRYPHRHIPLLSGVDKDIDAPRWRPSTSIKKLRDKGTLSKECRDVQNEKGGICRPSHFVLSFLTLGSKPSPGPRLVFVVADEVGHAIWAQVNHAAAEIYQHILREDIEGIYTVGLLTVVIAGSPETGAAWPAADRCRYSNHCKYGPLPHSYNSGFRR